MSDSHPAEDKAHPDSPAKIVRVSVNETRPLGAYRSPHLGAEAEVVGLERLEDVIRGLRAWLDRRFEELVEQSTPGREGY